jgi:hypothetical protein
VIEYSGEIKHVAGQRNRVVKKKVRRSEDRDLCEIVTKGERYANITVVR